MNKTLRIGTFEIEVEDPVDAWRAVLERATIESVMKIAKSLDELSKQRKLLADEKALRELIRREFEVQK